MREVVADVREVRLLGAKACDDFQRFGDIGVAEAVETARLDQPLGNIQDALGAVSILSGSRHRRSVAWKLTYRLVDK